MTSASEQLARNELKIRQLTAFNELLRKQVLDEMVASGLTKGETPYGTVSLRRKPAAARAITNPVIAELRSAIEAEQNELIETNGEALLELEAELERVQAQMAELTHSQWIQELEQKLQLELAKPIVYAEAGAPGQAVLALKVKQVCSLPDEVQAFIAKHKANWPDVVQDLSKDQLKAIGLAWHGLERSSEPDIIALFYKSLDSLLNGHKQWWEGKQALQ